MKLALLFFAPYLAYAAAPSNFDRLSQAPKVYEAQTQEPGVRALYFESVSRRGKPTRVFAHYGAPTGKKLPAMDSCTESRWSD